MQMERTHMTDTTRSRRISDSIWRLLPERPYWMQDRISELHVRTLTTVLLMREHMTEPISVQYMSAALLWMRALRTVLSRISYLPSPSEASLLRKHWRYISFRSMHMDISASIKCRRKQIPRTRPFLRRVPSSVSGTRNTIRMTLQELQDLSTHRLLLSLEARRLFQVSSITVLTE